MIAQARPKLTGPRVHVQLKRKREIACRDQRATARSDLLAGLLPVSDEEQKLTRDGSRVQNGCKTPPNTVL